MGFQSLIITNKQVKENMTLERVIECVENTWRWHGEGEVVLKPKITTDMAEFGVEGWFNSMPSYIHPIDTAGLKIVGGFANNSKLGMPYIKSNVILLDPYTGLLRALVCGDWISDARTGAQPAVAMKYLASDAKTVTIIGAGLQGFYCASCIIKSFDIDELRVCDICPQARERFSSFFPDAKFKITPYDSNNEACEGSDVIITVTTADAPLVHAAWCKPGCLVMPMGSYCEIADDLITDFDTVLTDHTEQAIHRGAFKDKAEKGLITADGIDAQLTEIIAGKKQGRRSASDRILCQLVGMGSPDLCIATEVYNNLLKSGADVMKLDMLG